jgi:hypothetical protein
MFQPVRLCAVVQQRSSRKLRSDGLDGCVIALSPASATAVSGGAATGSVNSGGVVGVSAIVDSSVSAAMGSGRGGEAGSISEGCVVFCAISILGLGENESAAHADQWCDQYCTNSGMVTGRPSRSNKSILLCSHGSRVSCRLRLRQQHLLLLEGRVGKSLWSY